MGGPYSVRQEVVAYVVMAYSVMAHILMAYVFSYGMSREALGEAPIQRGQKSWPI